VAQTAFGPLVTVYTANIGQTRSIASFVDWLYRDEHPFQVEPHRILDALSDALELHLNRFALDIYLLFCGLYVSPEAAEYHEHVISSVWKRIRESFSASLTIVSMGAAEHVLLHGMLSSKATASGRAFIPFLPRAVSLLEDRESYHQHVCACIDMAAKSRLTGHAEIMHRLLEGSTIPIPAAAIAALARVPDQVRARAAAALVAERARYTSLPPLTTVIDFSGCAAALCEGPAAPPTPPARTTQGLWPIATPLTQDATSQSVSRFGDEHMPLAITSRPEFASFSFEELRDFDVRSGQAEPFVLRPLPVDHAAAPHALPGDVLSVVRFVSLPPACEEHNEC
jgi:hypothetical protein